MSSNLKPKKSLILYNDASFSDQMLVMILNPSFLCLFSAHFDSKGIVEEYLHTKKLKERMNFTITRFSFYYNNFPTFMKPRRVDENTFVYDIPMQGVPMDGVDVTQGGECVYGMQHLIFCKSFKGASVSFSYSLM